MTPDRILGAYGAQWSRHKCERIAHFAAHYAGLIRVHLPDCVIGAYMCPWTPDEFDGALTRIFAQDYALLSPAIDVFTPLIYAEKSRRPASWGREWLEQAPGFVPPNRKTQLILDVLDFPDSLISAAESDRPGWGIQLFGGAQVFGDEGQAHVWGDAVADIRRRRSLR